MVTLVKFSIAVSFISVAAASTLPNPVTPTSAGFHLPFAFVENHGPAATLIRRNLDSLGVRTGAHVLATDAMKGLEKLAVGAQSFEFVYIDPPYSASEDYDRVLKFLGSRRLLAPGATVIAEHRRTRELPEQIGCLCRVRVLRQGDAALTFSASPNPCMRSAHW